MMNVMNVMNVICMLTILDKTTKRVFGKRTTSKFKQILSRICSNGVDVTDDESELHALNFSGKGILLETLLGIHFWIRIPSFDDLFEEKKTSQQLFYLSEVETLMEKTVEILSVFTVQRKISLLFQIFEVKIHLKLL